LPRTYVITGSASGMGAAARTLLEAEGARVVGVDRHDAEVVADLATAAGREAMVEAVRAAAGDSLDGVIACAGVGGGGGSDVATIISVNYFGAVATLEGLRSLLARSAAPRAVCVSSNSGVLGHLDTTWDEALVEACLAGDEAAAVAHGAGSGQAAYAAAKRALIRWARRSATREPWAGAGITLNVVAPGVVRTPINDYLFDTPEKEADLRRLRPQPLGWGRPEHVASLLVWLAGEGNAFVTGQRISADLGRRRLRSPRPPRRRLTRYFFLPSRLATVGTATPLTPPLSSAISTTPAGPVASPVAVYFNGPWAPIAVFCLSSCASTRARAADVDAAATMAGPASWIARSTRHIES
jgi:NAD(P)-dependent dehydrogenase (short-subunit alcohol dehydrogenase family)